MALLQRRFYSFLFTIIVNLALRKSVEIEDGLLEAPGGLGNLFEILNDDRKSEPYRSFHIDIALRSRKVLDTSGDECASF